MSASRILLLPVAAVTSACVTAAGDDEPAQAAAAATLDDEPRPHVWRDELLVRHVGEPIEFSLGWVHCLVPFVCDPDRFEATVSCAGVDCTAFHDDPSAVYNGYSPDLTVTPHQTGDLFIEVTMENLDTGEVAEFAWRHEIRRIDRIAVDCWHGGRNDTSARRCEGAGPLVTPVELTFRTFAGDFELRAAPPLSFETELAGCSGSYCRLFPPPGWHQLIASWNELSVELAFEVGRAAPDDGPWAPPRPYL